MTRTKKLILLALLLLSWQDLAYPTDWPSYQHDPEHTGRSSAVLDASKLMLSWTALEGYSTPQIVGNTIYSTKSQGGYSGSMGGGQMWATYITAFDLQTGAIKWTRSGNNIFPSHAAVGGGLVVFHGGRTCSSCSTPTPDAEQLVVLDAATGALRYKVAGIAITVGAGTTMMMPLLVPNLAEGTVMAYCTDGATIWAVRLGPTSGSIVWTRSGQFGGDSMPTLAGSSVVVAGPGQFYAFDQATGAPNHFHQGSVHGSGGTTVSYDSGRRNIYVLEAANPPGDIYNPHQALTAFRYHSNAQIEFLWQRFGDGIGTGSVAVGPNGNVYVAGGSQFLEINPDTGVTLRSVAGSFYDSGAPAITEGLVWICSEGKTMVHNLETMERVRTLPGSNSGQRYLGAGAFADDYFVMQRGDTVFSKGFDVWARPTARPLNISTRLRAQANGGREMYAGLIISGSDPKRVLIRALGPNLQQFGISDTLPDPSIELHDSSRVIGTNNNWRDSQAAEIQASGLAPVYDSEAAMIVTLNPGAYTAVVRDANGGAGIALVEVYDQEREVPVKLSNLSTRGYVETGDNMMIGGFILGNEDVPALVVIRALGPSLVRFGSTDFLPDPVMELHDANGALLRSNDNWRDTQEAEIAATGLAPENNAEAAIISTLPPSAYTAIIAGRNGQSGIGVVEVYHVR